MAIKCKIGLETVTLYGLLRSWCLSENILRAKWLFIEVTDPTRHVYAVLYKAHSVWTTILKEISNAKAGPQSVGHLTHKSGVLGSIPDLATYFRFSFRFFKKGSCQLLAKVCARSTG